MYELIPAKHMIADLGPYPSFISGFFRDMLSDSISSSDIDHPLPVYEKSADFELMLSIITGHAQEVLSRVKTWSQAKALYDLAMKYQLDGHLPWFSWTCRKNASQYPWEGIILATNQSSMDTDLIRTAITDGFKEQGFDGLYNPAYFASIRTGIGGGKCWTTFQTCNTTIAFGIKLGLSGLMAYNLTFGTIMNTFGVISPG